MVSIVESLTQGLNFLKYLNPFDENFILKTLLDNLNPFSDNFILKDVVDFLGNILSYINPFSENFFGINKFFNKSPNKSTNL